MLDVPEVNPVAVGLAERHGLKRSSRPRACTPARPAIDLAHIDGIMTFELG